MILVGRAAPIGRVKSAIAELDDSADTKNSTASCPTIIEHSDIPYSVAIARPL
jgi:hypothetical protein